MTVRLHDTAARSGGHCWIERRLFEVLGAWGVAVTAPAAKLALDRHSLHAAWRAEQWFDRLPVLAGIEREDLVVPPPGWDRLLGPAGAHAASAEGDAAVLAVAYRVAMARLVTRYRDHRTRTSPVADGPVIRTLGHAGADARADWEEGEALVQAALGDRSALDAASEAVRHAEATFVAGPPFA
jgi:hypothetical protein